MKVNMKRIALSLVLVMLLLVMCPTIGALAEELPVQPTQEELGYPEFVVAATTTLSGTFFTNMWGNNTCDIDVRSLIHGYSPVVWTMQSRFEIDPQVVESVQGANLENGNKMYMVQLKRDLTYNDGTPITAKDYLFSMMLFADPVINQLGAISTNYGYVAGYEDYVAGNTQVFSGLNLVDQYTYAVEIKKEYLPFFFEIAMLDAIPYPISVIAPGCDILDDGDGAYIKGDSWNVESLRETILDPDTGYLANPMVSCGPYMLTDFDWDTREARFDLNPYYKGYYDEQKPTIDHLVFTHVIPEDMIERYESGEIHLLNKVVYGQNIEDGITLNAEGQANMQAYNRMGAGFLSFACEQGPMQFEAVRKAIAYSLDRDEFNTQFTNNFGLVVEGYYGIGQWMVNMIGGTLKPEGTAADDEDGWESLVLKGLADLEHYVPDLDKAKALLVSDGWTLNEKGAAFQEGTDAVRYKQLEDGSLMGLNIRYIKMKDSVAAQLIQDMLEEPLREIGMALDISEMAIEDLFFQYYRQEERQYDMIYIATNFISIFDPYFVFNTEDAYQGTQNTTGYRDGQLEKLALELRQTEPGALLEYCQKWVKFQDYFNEKIPMLPLYSNVYFDFYVKDLQHYNPSAEMNWPVAILYATLGEDVSQAMEELSDDVIILED